MEKLRDCIDEIIKEINIKYQRHNCKCLLQKYFPTESFTQLKKVSKALSDIHLIVSVIT